MAVVVRSAQLMLPNHRTMAVACGSTDISITAPIVASGGDWEPHIRRVLEQMVQPEWICLDIGANIGAHALAMAVLAPEGRVVAFEADSQNFRWLSDNLAALGRPKASTEAVNCALWDKGGSVRLSSIEELSGCCFVSDSEDATESERRIRDVVSPAAIGKMKLHLQVSAVPSVCLDDWVERAALPHIDLVKMDVEGAEIRVLRGGLETFRRFRPILITEYNADCAQTYHGDRADAYFETLRREFAVIRVIEPDGSLSAPIEHWAALDSRLRSGRGWEDLLCKPDEGRHNSTLP